LTVAKLRPLWGLSTGLELPWLSWWQRCCAHCSW